MTTKQNIFITGISGSVGHYLFDLLAGNQKYQLYLLLRKPEKLKRDLRQFNNITVVREDLHNIHLQKELFKQMDYVILIATTWGGYRRPWKVNVNATFRILRALDRQRIKKIIYFSTASILNREHRPVEEIRTIGTNYIRSKFLAHKMLKKHPLKDKVITLFPTWVFGGDETHPYSHAALGIKGLKKSIRFLKYFSVDFTFHFIHCRDIALMTVYLLENNGGKNEYVLGNEPLKVGNLLKEAAAFFGQKTPFQIKVPMGLVLALSKLKKTHPWDNYCLRYRHFVYETLSCPKLGLPSDVATVNGLLASFFEAH